MPEETTYDSMITNNDDRVETFTDLQQRVSVWSQYNFPNNEPYFPLLGVTEEVGELNHAYLKSLQGIRGSSSQHRNDMRDSVGDIFVYLADFCEANDLDMTACVNYAWDQVKKRDWQRYPETGLSPVVEDLEEDFEEKLDKELDSAKVVMLDNLLNTLRFLSNKLGVLNDLIKQVADDIGTSSSVSFSTNLNTERNLVLDRIEVIRDAAHTLCNSMLSLNVINTPKVSDLIVELTDTPWCTGVRAKNVG